MANQFQKIRNTVLRKRTRERTHSQRKSMNSADSGPLESDKAYLISNISQHEQCNFKWGSHVKFILE